MKKKVPHTFIIIFFLIILSALLTWVVPAGEFDHEVINMDDGTYRTVIVDQLFHQVEASPQTWQVFAAFFKGFERNGGIVVFIIMISRAFWILNSTKLIDVSIRAFLGYDSITGVAIAFVAAAFGLAGAGIKENSKRSHYCGAGRWHYHYIGR